MNEDQFLIGNSVFGVFDGATSLQKYVDEQGRTGGFLASHITKGIFAKENASLADLAQSANQSLAQHMREQNIDISDKVNLWATSIAAVSLHETYFKWITISDSVIIALYEDGTHKMIGDYIDHDIETLRLKKMHAGHANIWTMIDQAILDDRRKMNIEYGVLDGEPEAVEFLQIGEESLECVTDIIISTDGLFIPVEEPGMEDWNAFVNLYRQGGLRSIYTEVREREKSDPNMVKYTRFKMHDDIAAISLSFSSKS